MQQLEAFGFELAAFDVLKHKCKNEECVRACVHEREISTKTTSITYIVSSVKKT